MRLIILSLILLISANAQAWLCEEAGSLRLGSTIKACGVGQAADEGEARNLALQEAAKEFQTLCSQDKDCSQKKVQVEPKRTTCEQKEKLIKCVRMVEYTFTEDTETTSETAAAVVPAGQIVPKTNVKSWSYDEIKNFPKIKNGMSKQDVLATFGKPDHVQKLMGGDFFIFTYIDKDFCERSCSISIKDDQVFRNEGFKIEFTEDLKDEWKTWWIFKYKVN